MARAVDTAPELIALDCPYCESQFFDRARIYNHIFSKHGRTKAKRYKRDLPAPNTTDSEAEYEISRMIGCEI